MEINRLNALINLLDDPDITVFETVEKELLKENEQIIPVLERKWEQSFDEKNQERIENLIQSIQSKKTFSLFYEWAKRPQNEQNLLDIFYIFDRIQYPDLNRDNIDFKIERLRKSIWLELKSSLTLLEKATILNHFIYNLNGYSINLSNPHSPQNCFLNQLLDTKRGNPISISIFYTIIARSIGLPAKLVDFPKNPLVAIVNAEIAKTVHGEDYESEIIFYINPSNKGAITSRKEIDYHLWHNNFSPISNYAEPMCDKLFIQRLLESLKESYTAVGFTDKIQKIEKFLTLFYND